jgi:hypothetical protein
MEAALLIHIELQLPHQVKKQLSVLCIECHETLLCEIVSPF